VRRRTRDLGAEVVEEEYKPPDIKEVVHRRIPDEPKPTVHDLQKRTVVKKTRLTIGQYYTDLASGSRQDHAEAHRSDPRSTWTQSRTASLSEFCQYLTRQGGVRRSGNRSCDGVGAGTVQDLHREAQGSGRVLPQARWTAPASGTSGWEVVALSVTRDRPVDRVAAFQEVSQEVGAKVRDGATVSVQWSRGIWPVTPRPSTRTRQPSVVGGAANGRCRSTSDRAR
jgi:hypothetical protein